MSERFVCFIEGKLQVSVFNNKICFSEFPCRQINAERALFCFSVCSYVSKFPIRKIGGGEGESRGGDLWFCPIKRWILMIGRNEELVLQGATEDVPSDLRQ